MWITLSLFYYYLCGDGNFGRDERVLARLSKFILALRKKAPKFGRP